MAPNPKNNIFLLDSNRICFSGSLASTSIFPLKGFNVLATKNGTTKQTIEGITIHSTNPIVVTFLPIHSIVVVTSPIGLQAPPAFAAITIKEAYQILSFLSLIMETILGIIMMIAIILIYVYFYKWINYPKDVYSGNLEKQKQDYENTFPYLIDLFKSLFKK